MSLILTLWLLLSGAPAPKIPALTVAAHQDKDRGPVEVLVNHFQPYSNVYVWLESECAYTRSEFNAGDGYSWRRLDFKVPRCEGMYEVGAAEAMRGGSQRQALPAHLFVR